jgi:predicted transcriptional regulator
MTIENIIKEIHMLSEPEQRALASAVLADRELEAFVEELDDQLNCEKAVVEGSAELFS